MIIKRKYACYSQLMDEPESKGIILDVFKKHGVDDEQIEFLMQANAGIIVHNTDMGSCIPGAVYQDFCAAFDELDKKKPFDNQLTYEDVSGVVNFANQKGNAMTQVMYCRCFDMPIRIVQVIAFEHDGVSIKPIEPWDLPQIAF